jgi:hypothetical protein
MQVIILFAVKKWINELHQYASQLHSFILAYFFINFGNEDNVLVGYDTM